MDSKHPNQELVSAGARVPARPGYIDVPAPYYGGEAYAAEDGGGLLEYWRIIRRRRGALILIAFCCLLAAVLITLPQTPVYQARASLEIQNLNENFLNIKEVSPVSESSAYNALTDIQTQIRILQSESLLDRVKQKLKAEYDEGLKPVASRISAWRQALNLPEPAPTDAREETLKSVADSLTVRAAGQTRIIEVRADSIDPALAAAFANALLNEFIDQNMEARWKMSQRTGDWLSRQLDDMRINLEHSEDALQSYARQTGLLFTSEKQNISEEKLRQLQAELSKAQADRVSRQSRYEMARSASPEALPDVLNDRSLRDYQTKLTDLRRAEAEMIATYKPEYSKVKRVQAQIAPLEAALERERSAIIGRIRNEYDEALRREKLLTTDYAGQARLVNAEAEKAIQYNILKREVDTNRQLYESMLQRVKESSIASAMKASNVRIVDAARPPKSPYKPKLLWNSALGLLGGLFLGVFFIVMRERADRTLQEPGDAAFYVGLPELGVIPSAEASARQRLYYIRRRKLAAAEGAAEAKSVLSIAKAAPAHDDRVELVTWQRKPSMIAEAFRVTLTSILFSGHNGSRPRVLVLTSPGPGEGKTTVVSNLGIAIAEIRQKVLLIDADLRKPRLHDIFAVPNERGLSTLLEQRPLPAGALEELIHATSVPGLFVLPSGPPTAAAANLLHSPSLAAVLERARESFDMVLIDTPPMLQMPDARVVGRISDAVLLVARAGNTTRDTAVAARQRFAEDGIRLLGTVLNNWDFKASPSGYSRYYGGYNGYSNAYSHVKPEPQATTSSK
ncbi:MAG: polysaccharide biosynthesis tyrosine autokinase [Acidobacteria bacterium]|nr:polysaccharide biosynthesis tyrosine autokinase [Acidobacteriota bacterium]